VLYTFISKLLSSPESCIHRRSKCVMGCIQTTKYACKRTNLHVHLRLKEVSGSFVLHAIFWQKIDMTLVYKVIIILFLHEYGVKRGTSDNPLHNCNQPPVQWVPGGKARPGRDADHSPPSSAKVVNE
jgi:hypothetical protein